ncbi:MAG: adenylate/guanylate cyclase domain-containing protein, partial [Thermohalobaculum sp.]|nr:adenylate/guanylate cyclase domain-containing protein [Thermohalobaculum sp.]
GALYALRGPLVAPGGAPGGAVVVGLDQKSVDWLAFHAPDLARVSDDLPACLPAPARAGLSRLRNVNDIPRAIHACLLRALAARGARLVVVDVLFTVETPDDAFLAAALREGPPVVLFERIRDAAEQGAGRGEAAAPQRVRPRPIFAEAAAATASFLVSAPSGSSVEGYLPAIPDFPDLAAMPETAAALWRGLPPPTPAAAGAAVRPIWLYGPPRTVPTFSLRDVFARDAARPLPGDLSGVAVFVGVSDPDFLGTTDHFVIPISDRRDTEIGGVELAASAFLNILHDQRMRHPGAGVQAAVVFVFGTLGALVVQLVGGWRGLGVLSALGIGYAGAAGAGFAGFRIWLPVAMPLFAALPALGFWALLTRYARARGMVARLAPRQVTARLLDRPGAARDGLRTEALSVLYTDVVGSTALGDRLDPEGYSRTMTRYYDRATAAVEAAGGMVVEFMGDGILAVFTESVTGPGHARAACAAARALSGDGGDLATPADPDEARIRLRMGLHTGVATTGGIGAAHRFNFKVLGDAVNFAARLEQLGKAFDDGARDVILISEATRAASGLADAEVEPLGTFELRGKDAAVQVFRLRTGGTEDSTRPD